MFSTTLAATLVLSSIILHYRNEFSAPELPATQPLRNIIVKQRVQASHG